MCGAVLWLILALVALVIVAVWITWTAGRVDRLQARLEASWLSLDAQLVRRGIALAQATEGQPEHTAATRAVRAAAGAPREARASAENEVSSLIAALSPQRLTDDLHHACTRVKVARTFYNDAVRASGALAAQRIPRLLRGYRALEGQPYFDIDDDPGTGLPPTR